LPLNPLKGTLRIATQGVVGGNYLLLCLDLRTSSISENSVPFAFSRISRW
jgi:hypothetical protein